MSKIYNYATHSDELKHCPFCGNKPLWYYHRIHDNAFEVIIECLSCQISMRITSLNNTLRCITNEIKTKWNNRVNHEHNNTTTD
jgi:hypothetical protein